MIWVDHISGHYRLTLGGTFGNYLDSGRTPAIGHWQHVAATYDGTTARFYIDGVAGRELDLHRQRRRLQHLADRRLRRDRRRVLRRPGRQRAHLHRALSPSEIQTDMASRIQPDLTPPTVTAFTPVSGKTGVNVGSTVTATFSRTLQPSTVNANTFLLKDPAGNTVPATISYNSSANVATLDPTAALLYGTVYTGRAAGRRSQGPRREPDRSGRSGLLHHRSLAAPGARGRLERQSVRHVPERDPAQRGARRLHDAGRNAPLELGAEQLRRRGAGRREPEHRPDDDLDGLGQRRRQADRDAP